MFHQINEDSIFDSNITASVPLRRANAFINFL